jgi:hypothetical protein
MNLLRVSLIAILFSLTSNVTLAVDIIRKGEVLINGKNIPITLSFNITEKNYHQIIAIKFDDIEFNDRIENMYGDEDVAIGRHIINVDGKSTTDAIIKISLPEFSRDQGEVTNSGDRLVYFQTASSDAPGVLTNRAELNCGLLHNNALSFNAFVRIWILNKVTNEYIQSGNCLTLN